MIKRLTFLFVIISVFSIALPAQKDSPNLLPTPEDWRFEKIDFPLDFAPHIEYEGFEELRFAPGMFDTLSSTYFTYVFALSINNKTELKKSEIRQFLTKYYKGLCRAVAKSKKLTVDVSEIKVSVEKLKKPKSKIQTYWAQANFFDVFTNGQEVELNLELEVVKRLTDNKLYLLALVSPHKKESKIWKDLYEIRKKIKKESSVFKM